MQPGYLPMAPNGDPMFRGSQFNSRINGGQARAVGELLRRRRVRICLRPPGEPGERSSRRGHPGGHGHHHDLFRPVRPHQRRLHRVHLQVGHQQVPRQRLQLPRQRRPQLQGLLQAPEDPARQQELGGDARRAHHQEQDVLLRQRRLDPVPLRHAGGLRQHDADRRVQGRRLQRAADRQPDRHGRRSAGRSSGARSSIPRPRARSTGSSCATPIRATSSRPVIPCGAWSPRATPPSWCTPTVRACRTTWPATRRATRRGSWTRATSSSASTTSSRPSSRGCSAATTTTARRCVTAAGPRAAPSRTTP